MSSGLWRVVLSISLLSLVPLASPGAGFDPAFTVTGVTGACEVRAPGDVAFSAAEDGKTYPYGTTLRTKADSAATIVFAKDSTCVLTAKTVVVVGQLEDDPKAKVLELKSGKIKLALAKDFAAHNSLSVLTPASRCVARDGAGFTVAYALQVNVQVTTVACIAGGVEILSTSCLLCPLDLEVCPIHVPLLQPGGEVALDVAMDNSFGRVRALRSSLLVQIRNEDGTLGDYELAEGTAVRMTCRQDANQQLQLATVSVLDAIITLEMSLPPQAELYPEVPAAIGETPVELPTTPIGRR